ncbi:acyltransferase [Bifidobacterium pseudolongum]|uniref:acyltransferase family protein n=1 Tax=Bifidobacterium pseudolongum TaxID=1694 RepID=UPI001F0E3CE3|nr:acyltransferase [Bifidobacterium pseudolongum]MCH4853774.1 acyltransferase [Bifidobacterium pseudolongum]
MNSRCRAIEEERGIVGIHKTLQSKKIRNSNVELVRLLAMVMIVLNHTPWANCLYVDPNIGYIRRWGTTLTVSFLSNWGGVGDCLFFIISAWFLCEENQSLKRNIARCWHLEKQLWFWSITLFVGCLVAWHMQGGMPGIKTLTSLGVKTVFPLATNLWWYPTSYVLFLLICPLLTQGLQLLTRERHATLCIGLLLIFGWMPESIFPLDMKYSIILFVYLYILICFIKWHIPSMCKSRLYAYHFIVVGSGIALTSQALVQCMSPNKIMGHMWMNSPRCISSICIALGIVIIATTSKAHHSQTINYVASSTLAVYLVCTHQFIKLALRPVMQYIQPGAGGVVKVLMVALSIYTAALSVDMMRHWVFGWLVDRNVGCQNAWIIGKLERIRNYGIQVIERLDEKLLNGV